VPVSKKLSEVRQQLKDSLELLKIILGSDLLGVYLYGSSLVGGLQRYSDIDLFIVTNRKTTLEEKTRLIADLLQVSGIYMKSSKFPVEMTLVEKTAITPWQYPPHFDFQYGEWLRTSFEEGIVEPWQTYEMHDLALIVTQVLLKSQTLWGLEPGQLLAHVPYHDFMKAMLHDLNRLAAELEDDTRNVLLTYARIWSTLETNAIRSKPAAADWVINHLPKKYQPVMKRAKSICIGKENEYWDDVEVLIKSCADFIVNKINTKIPLIKFDDPKKSITVVEEPFSGDSSLQSGLRGEFWKSQNRILREN
jgi:predicted nucleotidyltransferase